VFNLPSSLVYYSRQFSNAVASRPSADQVLNLKFHKQEHSLSCEAATLKMVLDFYGMNVSESDIISKMPADPTPRSNDAWGEPNIGFVGNIDGKMMVDGYGIYWGPLAITSS